MPDSSNCRTRQDTASPVPEATNDSDRLSEIGIQPAQLLFEAGTATFVDVRDPHSFQAEHVFGRAGARISLEIGPMGRKQRFIRITSELALIRETHRTVLQWMRFEGRQVELSSVTLTPRCLATCAAALSGDTFDWSNESGSLRVRRSGDCLELCFRIDGGKVEKTILLNGEEGRAFTGGTQQFAGRKP